MTVEVRVFDRERLLKLKKITNLKQNYKIKKWKFLNFADKIPEFGLRKGKNSQIQIQFMDQKWILAPVCDVFLSLKKVKNLKVRKKGLHGHH